MDERCQRYVDGIKQCQLHVHVEQFCVRKEWLQQWPGHGNEAACLARHR